MEGGREAGEFHDWEVLRGSDESGLVNPEENSGEDLGGVEGIIRSDYFSLDSIGKYARTVSEASVESDNPSWIEPDSEGPYPAKKVWSDSGSDRSDDRKFNDFDAKNELGFLENAKDQLGVEGVVGKTGAESNRSGKLWSGLSGDRSDDRQSDDFDVRNELGFVENAKNEPGLEGIGAESGDSGEFWSGSSGIGPNGVEVGGIGKDNEIGTGDSANSLADEKAEEVGIEAVKTGGGEEKRTVVWWKVPMEFLKYCVFRASPVWTFSVAAAVMGFLILGRKLFKMKRKSRNLQLKVTLDDTKVSQFMKRAARLNEAFSVVKRVPIVRPSLPAAGVTPWPVMSLR